MTKEKLEEKKQELQKLQELKAELIQKRQSFLENDIIQEFLALEDLLNEANKKSSHLEHIIEAETQDWCPHPVWCVLDKDTDPYEGRTYLRCICIECGKIEEGMQRDFPSEQTIYSSLENPLGQVFATWKNFKKDAPQTQEQAKKFTKMIKAQNYR